MKITKIFKLLTKMGDFSMKYNCKNIYSNSKYSKSKGKCESKETKSKCRSINITTFIGFATHINMNDNNFNSIYILCIVSK